MRIKKVFYLGIIFAMLAGMFFFPAALSKTQASPGVLIDHFDDEQTLTQTGIGTSYSTLDTVSGLVLGVERDMAVEVTSGDGAINANANATWAGELTVNQDSGVAGRTLIVYDGNDSDATSIDTTGLSNYDLTNLGADNALVVAVTSNDVPVDITLTIYNGTACSSFTVTTPGLIFRTNNRPRAFIFPFSEFNVAGSCSGPADFAAVGALAMLIDGYNEATDITVHYLAATNVDFGDLPNTYGTTADFVYTTNPPIGAAHVMEGGLFLGALIDGETNGQPSANANLDDTTDLADEDGVVRSGNWQAGVSDGSTVNVTVNGGDGCLSAWIDWDNSGTFTNSGAELIINNLPVTTGVIPVNFTTPEDSFPSQTNAYNARFRLYPRDSGGTCVSIKYPNAGHETSGEVEDYHWEFGPTAISLESLKASATPGNLPLVSLALLVFILSTAMGVMFWQRRRTH